MMLRVSPWLVGLNWPLFLAALQSHQRPPYPVPHSPASDVPSPPDSELSDNLANRVCARVEHCIGWLETVNPNLLFILSVGIFS